MSRQVSRTSKHKKEHPKERQYASSRDSAMFKQVNSQSRIVTLKVAGTNFSIQTNVGGTYGATAIATSNNLSGTADFANLAGLYTAYRCKAMKIMVRPFYPCNTTGITVPAAIAIGDFVGGLGGATYASVRQQPEGRVCSGYKAYDFYCDYRGNKDAQLWSQTTAPISTAESYGIIAVGFGIGATPNTYFWSVDIDYLVEFRTPY